MPQGNLQEEAATYAWKNYPNSRPLKVTITAYCPCHLCCGKSDGITSSGRPARANHTVAIDPNIIPLGSKVYLEGIGTFVAEDTGGLIKGNRIDLFMENHHEALKFGIKTTTAYILEERV